MDKKIEKPTILKLREFENDVINLINNSGIPVFVLKPSIEKIYKQLEVLEEQEFLREQENYKNMINDKKSGDNK